MDNVNHPKHYEGSTSVECIEAMEVSFGTRAVIDFCICNAFKYLWRHKNKNGAEDLDKAIWYCDKAEELCEKHFDETDFKVEPIYFCKHQIEILRERVHEHNGVKNEDN